MGKELISEICAHEVAWAHRCRAGLWGSPLPPFLTKAECGQLDTDTSPPGRLCPPPLCGPGPVLALSGPGRRG